MYGEFGAIYLRLPGSKEVVNLRRAGSRPVPQVWRTEPDHPAMFSTDQYIGYGLPIEMVVDTGSDTNVAGHFAGDLDDFDRPARGPGGCLEGVGGASVTIMGVYDIGIKFKGAPRSCSHGAPWQHRR